MATQVNRRRGTTAQHAVFTGAVGESTYNTDVKILVAHDGATVGGFPAAHLHVANIFSQPQTISVLSGAPTNAFDIQTDAVSRVTFRKSGFGVFHRQEADVAPGGIELTKRGTTGNALAALSSGSAISTIDWLGWDGAALGGAGGIRMFTNQAWTGAAHGSKLFFTTVPAGSTSTVNSMELDNTALTVLSRLLLPNTTSATVGGIYFGGTRAVHNFGTFNFFAGVTAGNLTLTGTLNVGVGVGALDALTSGGSNSAVGVNALGGDTTGGNNTAFGFQTLLANTIGQNNTALGSGALASNISGSSNNATGVGALSSSTGNNNTASGFNSLFFCTGNNNVGLGYAAGNNLTTGSNNIVIGYDIDSPTATNSNTLTIGNLIFGTGVDGTGATISSGFVGIKVITPATELHVVTTSASDPRGIMSAQHSTDAIGARVHFRKSRGTATAPTTVVTGDVLGRLRFSGYDSANYLQMGSIDVVSVGTIAATRVPTFMAFSTATDATPSVLTERLRIDQAGKIQILTGVGNDAGGFKHARVTTGSVGAGSTALVTITWTTAFADTNYTVNASVLEATTSSLSMSVVHIESITAAAVTVRVLNNAVGSLTGTVHVIAVHD